MVDNLYDYKMTDRKLALGMDVYASWTNDGFHHREKAIIVKLDDKTVTVRLQQARMTVRQVVLPRFSDQTRWSFRNCVWPTGRGFAAKYNL